MDASFTHAGFIQYNLHTCLLGSTLEVTLSISDQERTQRYRSFFNDESLPTKLKKEFKTAQNLFPILEKRKNFIVDPVRGQLILIIRKVEMNEFREEEVELKLNPVEEKNIGQRGGSEKLGGETKNLQFLEFGGEGKVVEGIEKEMKIFTV